MKQTHDEQEDCGEGLSMVRRVLGFDPAVDDGSMERMLGLPIPAHLKSATVADIGCRYSAKQLDGGCQLISLKKASR
jgi:hypothetical protein